MTREICQTLMVITAFKRGTLCSTSYYGVFLADPSRATPCGLSSTVPETSWRLSPSFTGKATSTLTSSHATFSGVLMTSASSSSTSASASKRETRWVHLGIGTSPDKESEYTGYCISNSLPPLPPPGCQVHPDRRVSRPRGWASEQPRSGRGGVGWGLGLHGRRGPVEPGHHPVGDVLRNQTQRHRPLKGVEGKGGRCGPQIRSHYLRVFILYLYYMLFETKCFKPLLV